MPVNSDGDGLTCPSSAEIEMVTVHHSGAIGEQTGEKGHGSGS